MATALGPDFLMSDDPILARILSLNALSHGDQLDWIFRVKWLLAERRANLAMIEPMGGYEDVVREASLRIIDTHLKCLNDLQALVTDERPAASSVN